LEEGHKLSLLKNILAGAALRLFLAHGAGSEMKYEHA